MKTSNSVVACRNISAMGSTFESYIRQNGWSEVAQERLLPAAVAYEVDTVEWAEV